MKIKNKKAFTLIELLVVMAVIGILVLLAMPKFMGYTEKARITEIMSNSKQLENASERYYMDKGDWPRLSDEPYTAEQLESFAKKIYDKTGKVVVLDENGDFYGIDYSKLSKYIQKPKDDVQYIIQNPVGEVYYLDELTDTGSQTLGLAKVPTPSIQVFGGSLSDYFSDIKQTSDGGYVVVGYSMSNDGDLINLNHGSTDGLIVKYDSANNIEWTKTFGGSNADMFHAVQSTKDGGYIVSGYTMSSDGDFTGYTLKGSSDVIILKLDSTGNKEWIKYYGGNSADDFYSIQETNDGYIFAGRTMSTTGDFSGLNQGNQDAIILKTDFNGNKKWMRNVGGTLSDDFKSVIQTNDGGYIAVGTFFSTNGNFYGLSTHINGYKPDGMAVKFDASGNIKWIKPIGGRDEDILYSISNTSDGGYIVAGYTASTDYDLSGLNKGTRDGFIIKFDSNNNKQWVKTVGGTNGDYINSIKQTIDGGYIAVGNSSSTDGDMEGLSKGEVDAIVIKFNSVGEKEWIKTKGGSGTEDLVSVIEKTKDNYISVGYSNSNDGDFAGVNKGSNDAIIFPIK